MLPGPVVSIGCIRVIRFSVTEPVSGRSFSLPAQNYNFRNHRRPNGISRLKVGTSLAV